MRLFEVVSMAKEYLLLGIGIVILAAIMFWVGYFIIYKNMMKGKKIINKKKILLSGILICYLVFVGGATLLDRGNGWYGNLNLQLFSSYHEAWNSFSPIDWRNIILNIFLFVPLGFLLPLWSDKFKMFWKTLIASASVTLFIECVQLFTGRGIFEIDDIINNTVGALTGYGIVMIFYILRSDIRRKARKVLGYLSPVILMSIIFITIFVAYDKQEYGNLSDNYSYKINMNNVNVNTNKQLKSNESEVFVYSADVATPDETLVFAKKFFTRIGTNVDEKQNDVYENTIVYRSSNGKLSIWVNFDGLTYSFTNFVEMESERNNSANEKTIRLALIQYGVDIPEKAEFSANNDGQYTFTIKMFESDGNIIDGTLSCTYLMNGGIEEISNNIIKFKPVDSRKIISEQEAYERIKQGKFNYINNEFYEILINDVKLGYRLDSKGFYQPIYNFNIKIDGTKSNIVIPALK